MSSQTIELSIIVPVYNEAAILEDEMTALAAHLDTVVGSGRWQFVFGENGSTDSTPQIIDRMIERWPTCICVPLDRPDYGNALHESLKAANGEWAFIINVDFWDEAFLRWCYAYRNVYQLILGSKRADSTLNQQQRYRRTLSWGLNTILQFVFGFTGSDTHGQKFLHLPSMRPILEQTILRRGQYDTEFTLRALRMGYWMAEVPVPIIEVRRQKNLMIQKILRNIRDVLRLRRIMKGVPFQGSLRYHRWARADVVTIDEDLCRAMDAHAHKVQSVTTAET